MKNILKKILNKKKDPLEDHEKFKDVKQKYEKYFKENLE